MFHPVLMPANSNSEFSLVISPCIDKLKAIGTTLLSEGFLAIVLKSRELDR